MSESLGTKIKCIWRNKRALWIEAKAHVQLVDFQRQWRQKNQHNGTVAKTLFPIDQVSVGEKTYGGLHVYSFLNEKERLTIGNFCSIAGEVAFILGGEHSKKTISTFPFYSHVFEKQGAKTPTKGPICVEDDVWIGHRATILSGVTIGKGSIIGAGSVVSKDVPPYAIYGGNRVIGYRFSNEIIEKLKKVDLTLAYGLNKDEIEYFCVQKVTEESIDSLLSAISSATEKP